jgi:uncharacterized membrane protein YuzA (DUF378 family)
MCCKTNGSCGTSGCGSCGGGCVMSLIAKILLIVGGLNWGLVGAGLLSGSMNSWNIVNMCLGSWPVVEGLVYVLVGVAALASIFGCRCAKCKSGCGNCVSCSTSTPKTEVKTENTTVSQ